MPRIGNNIYKRKDGRWEGRYIRGYNESSKAVYGFVYAKTYKEVKSKLLMSQSGIVSNTGGSGNKLTFTEVSRKWLFNISLTVKQSTYAKYIYTLETHILPTLGGYRLHKLTSADIDNFTKSKLTDGRVDKDGGLSAKTVRDILSVIKSIIDFGEKEKLINKSYLTVTYPKSVQPDIHVISRQEQAILEDYLYKDIDLSKLGILICLYTGLRIGEICALQWKDISIPKSVISVTQTMQRVKNTDNQSSTKTKILIDTPKSKTSVRDIPVPKFIIDYLKGFRTSNLNGQAYLLTGTENKFIEPRTYQILFAKYIKSSGITQVNFHATRHTMATRCVEAGFDIKSLSEILGHANVSTTLNRYVHSSFEQKRKNMMKLERLSKD
jgi:integrase